MTPKRIYPERSRRTRGGQPGNQNARTHGSYSRALTPAQRQRLSSIREISGLDDEIAILRLKIESILVNDPQNTQVLMQALSLLSRLLQSKMRLDKGNPNSLKEAFANVFRDMPEMGIRPPLDGADDKPRFSSTKNESRTP